MAWGVDLCFGVGFCFLLWFVLAFLGELGALCCLGMGFLSVGLRNFVFVV